VFSRDVAQVMLVVMQLWFWLTPIVYPLAALPEDLRPIIGYNPMTPLVAIYQDALLFDRWPSLATLVAPALTAALVFLLAMFAFRRASPELVDAL
jgi:lipopolysaccharide transport system permease protein